MWGRLIITSLSVAALAVLAGCGEPEPPKTDPIVAVSPTLAPDPGASPRQYFADGKSYQAWVIGVKSGPVLTLDIAHHLVNSGKSSPATKYLNDHSAPPGPIGVPDDYINVDTHVHKSQRLASDAKIMVNPDANPPEAMTVPKFLDWLQINASSPLPTQSPEAYFGQPRYAGPLFTVKFKSDVIVSMSQIFEP